MPSASALLAAYNFDEGSGLRVADLTNNGHGGTLYGAAPVWVAGQVGHGNALSTNGGASGGGVSIGPIDSFDEVASGTIEAWVKYGGASGYHMWWDTRSATGCAHPLELAVDKIGSQLYFETWTESCISPTLQARALIPGDPNGWHHLAFESSPNGNQLYVDGMLAAPTYLHGSPASNYFLSNAGASSNTIYDVGGADVQYEDFSGAVDDVRVYSNALSGLEVRADMRTPVSTVPRCRDGIDNDGDGLIDFAQDPGCFGEDSEIEDPACQDGIDDDGDGGIDFDGGAAANHGVRLGAADLDCDRAYRPDERPGGCGLGCELGLIIPLLARWRFGLEVRDAHLHAP